MSWPISYATCMSLPAVFTCWLTPRSWAPSKMPLQGFPPSCATREVHYLAHKSPPLVPILSQTHNSSEIHFNNIFPSNFRFIWWHLPFLRISRISNPFIQPRSCFVYKNSHFCEIHFNTIFPSTTRWKIDAIVGCRIC
jgi:hypothetical protein